MTSQSKIAQFNRECTAPLTEFLWCLNSSVPDVSFTVCPQYIAMIHTVHEMDMKTFCFETRNIGLSQGYIELRCMRYLLRINYLFTWQEEKDRYNKL